MIEIGYAYTKMFPERLFVKLHRYDANLMLRFLEQSFDTYRFGAGMMVWPRLSVWSSISLPMKFGK